MMTGGGMALGLILVLLLVIGVPLLLIGGGLLLWANRRGAGSGSGATRLTSNATPREILDRRLANGEITTDEYREILSEISDGGSD